MKRARGAADIDGMDTGRSSIRNGQPILRLTQVQRESEGRRAGRMRMHNVHSDSGKVLDLSATGVRVLTKRPWQQGDEQIVRLQGGVVALRINARCVWVRKLGFRRYEVGLRFLIDDPALTKALSELGRSHACGRELWAAA